MQTDCDYIVRQQRPTGNYWWDDRVRYALSVVTQPTEEPVTVAQARAHCRVAVFDDDAWIYAAIVAARKLCETITKRAFCTTTFRLSLDQFPPDQFYLPRPPLVSVTSIKYLDSSGVQQTWGSSNYSVDIYSQPGRVALAYNTSFPSATRTDTNAIEVIYRAGYGAASAVPRSIKHAILMTVAHWNENREAVTENSMNELPMAAKALLAAESFGFLP